MSVGIDRSFDNRLSNSNRKLTKNDDQKSEVETKSNIELIAEWSKTSTMHGSNRMTLPNINFFHRIIWFLVVLFFGAYAIKEIYIQIRKYFDFDVKTTIKVIKEDKLSYPEVHLCNLYNYRLGVFDEFLDYYKTVEKVNLISILELELFYYFILFQKKEQLQLLFNKSFIPNKNKFEFFDMKLKTKSEKDLYLSGHQLDQIIISCYYGNRPCDLKKDFSWYYNYKYGNCYRFNSKIERSGPDDLIVYNETKTIETTQRPGPQNGLQLELYAGQWDISDTLTETGFKILLRNQSNEKTFPEDTGFTIAPNFATNIVIKPTIVNRLSYPYSDCVTFKDKMYFLISNTSKLEYKSQLFCNKICFQSYMVNKCGCADYRLPNDGNIFGKYCNTPKDYYCLDESSIKYYEKDIEKCTQACRPDCQQVIYDYSLFTAGYPNIVIYFFYFDFFYLNLYLSLILLSI
jgi:hypothetical protein